MPLESIDPIYFDRSHYLELQRDAVKLYLLLRDALVKYGRVAIGKIALRQREALAVLRVYADVILVNTMLWPDEVREPDFLFLGTHLRWRLAHSGSQRKARRTASHARAAG